MTRVLVVEDDPDIREATAELLRLSGYEVETIGDARQTLDTIRRQQPDVLLQDCHMPTLDLRSQMGMLRSTPGLEHLVIILFTASIEARGFWQELGADGLVRKPFEIDSLTAMIESHVGHAAAH